MSRLIVRVAEIRIGRQEGTLAALGLGSCVAAVLWDPTARVGGMAHVLLPSPPPRAQGAPLGRYAQTAVPQLVQEMVKAGALRASIIGRLVGGAAMFGNLIAPGLIHTGERNVLAAREALHTAGIPLRGEWVGGDFGRSVELDLNSGRLTAASVRHGSREL